MALIYFAVSLFVSAFLLFLVQPMIGKMILPRLGGTPQVWNTCMMFFQTVLLAGYAYTHFVTSKLPIKRQLSIHCIMLLLPMVVLLLPLALVTDGRPFYVQGFGAEGGLNPILPTLGLLTMVVGIPFLVVSTTAPLLQRWFHNTGHPAAKDPYFLYGASNAGSILGLLMYPLVVERYMGLDDQAWFWMWSYIVLALLVAGCAFMVLRAPAMVQLPGGMDNDPALEPPPVEMPEAAAPAPSTAVTATPPAPAVQRQVGIRRGGKHRGGRGGRGAPAPAVLKGPVINIKKVAEPHHVEEEKPFEMTPMRRLRWVGLAAVPSSLMLGFTTYISTDISPVPLLWIIPLTLYLLSFVLVFLRWPVPWVGVGRNPRGWTPHKVMVIAQLFCLPLIMLIIFTSGYGNPLRAMLVCWGGFFVTALVCHGELARDRPPAKYLTEFYLWMSVGGMLGGTFNALIAPMVPWWGLFEFPLALVFAGLVRPGQKGWNWTDFIFENMPKEQSDSLRYLLDIGLAVLLLAFSWWLIGQAMDPRGWNWNPGRLLDPRYTGAIEKNNLNPLYRFVNKAIGLKDASSYQVSRILGLALIYGLPIGLALLTWKRPTRLALCFGAVILGNAFYEASEDDRVLYRDRSYFGLLKVVQDQEHYKSGALAYRTTTLMHGTTHHGLNYHFPDGSDGSLDMTRLATTYYHRDCPVGVAMERLNWFPGYRSEDKDGEKRMTYWADARLPCSLIGSGVPGLGVNLPIAQLVSAWSEPPYATIGLGTGTMASYGRPFQHVTFYEIDEHIRNFSLPPPGRVTYFTYLQGALSRGCRLEVIMGDARLTMTKENENEGSTYYLPNFKDQPSFKEVSDGRAALKWATSTSYKGREAYYRVMEVDAFSSDAIPVHLITKEAIELYMNKLTYDGVLCVHTSNRHVNLVQPVLNICRVAEWKDWKNRDADGKPTTSTGLVWVICKDEGGMERGRGFDDKQPALNGHFGSEYVLVARKQEFLPPYELSEKEMERYKNQKIQAMSFNAEQDKKYRDKGVPVLPPIEHTGKVKFSSTIDFYGPNDYDNPKVNVLIHPESYPAGIKIMDWYGYYVPPGTRVWTDDYSNVLSVFRW